MAATIRVADCPLPEVAEALRPFIKPRLEVAAIRQGLQNYLEKQLHNDGTPLSPVNLTSTPTRDLQSPPSGLSGVRKAYWKALQAHVVAQTRYDAVRAELEDLKRPRVVPQNSKAAESSDAINETYIPLLRQRERYRKLKVLEQAFRDISAAGGDISAISSDESVKKALGELPAPPAAQPSFHKNPEVEAKIAELKKAVVSTKRKVDERNAKISVYVNDTDSVSPQAEIAGLQAALQTLTIWMEEQLTVIANAEAETRPLGTPAKAPDVERTTPSTEDIESLYAQYLEARQRFTETVNHPAARAPDLHTAELSDVPGAPKGIHVRPLATKSAAEALLPYLQTLIDLKHEEQSLIQQSSHTRQQLSTAEADTERLIHRLAEESHLVQPGASKGTDWADAASSAGTVNGDYVNGKLEAGEASTKTARDALKSIREVPDSLNRLLEEV